MTLRAPHDRPLSRVRLGRHLKLPGRPHQIVSSSASVLTCRICHCTARTESTRRVFRRAECQGSRLAGLAVEGRGGLAISNGHPLMSTGQWLWCLRCGCHAKKRLVVLAAKCLGRPSGGAYRLVLQRLASGKHPTTGQPLREAARRLSTEEWATWQAAQLGAAAASEGALH